MVLTSVEESSAYSFCWGVDGYTKPDKDVRWPQNCDNVEQVDCMHEHEEGQSIAVWRLRACLSSFENNVGRRNNEEGSTEK